MSSQHDCYRDGYSHYDSFSPTVQSTNTHFTSHTPSRLPGQSALYPSPEFKVPAFENKMALAETDTLYHEFVCGWGAAFFNITVTFPINKVMFRQQLHGVRILKAISGLRKEGIRNVYRGLPPPLLQKTFSMSLMFGTYYQLEGYLQQQYPSYRLLNKASAATLAGVAEAVLTPFERIQVLMQDRNYQTRFNNTLHAFSELKKYGITEYYRGLNTIIFRNCTSNILFFIVRDYSMENLPKPDSNVQRMWQDFLCGACLGAFLSTMYYPVNVVKVRQQCQLGGKFRSFIETLSVVWQERKSLKKLYRGVHVNYTRSFISWGIVNAVYEILMTKLFGRSTRLAEKEDGLSQ